MRQSIPWLLFASTLFLGLALVLPLMQTSAFYFFEDNPSIVGLLVTLYLGGEWLLLTIICLFAVTFPAAKLLVLHLAAYNGSQGRALALLSVLGRWSMLDVMVVALIIVAFKTSGLGDAASQPGLWFFAASTICAAAASEFIKRPPAA